MGKPNSECTIEELQSKAKTLKTLLGVIVAMLTLAAGCVIYLMATGSKFNAALIGAFVAILCGAIPSLSGLASIKKEIAKRNEG